MIISFIVAIIVCVIDQISKYLVYGTMSRSIIGNLLWFESTLNTGVAFSMFKNNSSVFIFTSSIASLIIIFFIVNKKIISKKNQKICLGFILGGTVANLIDRIIFGGVRDFIYLKFIDFAIFNIADMAISFGAGFLCLFIVLSEIFDNKNLRVSKVSTDDIEKNKMEKKDDADENAINLGGKNSFGSNRLFVKLRIKNKNLKLNKFKPYNFNIGLNKKSKNSDKDLSKLKTLNIKHEKLKNNRIYKMFDNNLGKIERNNQRLDKDVIYYIKVHGKDMETISYLRESGANNKLVNYIRDHGVNDELAEYLKNNRIDGNFSYYLKDDPLMKK